MKKAFRFLTAALLVFTVFILLSVPAFAASAAEVYSEKITASAGEDITVPVYIKNNPGLMGYKIIISYDNNVFTPVKVAKGDAISGGMFDDSISNTTKDQFFVVWSGTENSSGNGKLFTVTFHTAKDVKGQKTISISYSQDDTFNESWKDVKLNCSGATIDFGGTAEPDPDPVNPEPKPSFFRRIINFFVKIWNFIKGLFK